MVHFVLFSDQRLGGVPEFVYRTNFTDHTIDFVIIEDATTRELGGAAFSHHLVYPGDFLVLVPGVLDLFTWGNELKLYLPLYSTVEAAVAALAVCYHDILVNLLTIPIPCQLSITDMVGFDTLTWTQTPGDAVVQEWLDTVVPRVNLEADRVNTWIRSPNLFLSSRIHMTRRTADGTLRIHDYRTLPDGYAPGRRQQRRWARLIVNFLEASAGFHYYN